MIKKFLKIFSSEKPNSKDQTKDSSVKKQIPEQSKRKQRPDPTVDEYYFKVINWQKVDYQQETDPDILRSYGEFDEGEYPLHLKSDYLPNLHFYSNTDLQQLQFEIFTSSNFLHRPLYHNEEAIQRHFIDHHNTCFFYDQEISSEVQSNSKLLSILTLKDFVDVVLPNLIPELFVKVKQDPAKMMYYNWDFYKDTGHFSNGSNLLYQLNNHLPFPNLSKVTEIDKKQFCAYANLEELANYAEGVKLKGLLWNAEFFDQNYANDILEQCAPKYNSDVFEIKPKSRYLCNDLQGKPDQINTNLKTLNSWFFDEDNMAPFKCI